MMHDVASNSVLFLLTNVDSNNIAPCTSFVSALEAGWEDAAAEGPCSMMVCVLQGDVPPRLGKHDVARIG